MFRAKDIPGSYRFSFADSGSPDAPHIHVERNVERNRQTCMFLLKPLELMRNSGFNARELLAIRRILETYQENLLDSWKQHGGVARPKPEGSPSQRIQSKIRRT